TAATAMRAADPQAKIVGLGGVTDYSWCEQVLKALGPDYAKYIDFAATHQYPKNSPRSYSDFHEHITKAFGLETWNTEAGVWDRGFYQGENSGFIEYDELIWPHLDSERYHYGARGAAELTAQSFLRTIGTGFSKYFYYDDRIYVGPGYFRSHSTVFEYDDSI